MLSCRDLYGFIDQFLDGSLDLGPRAAFTAHLAVCGACRRYLASYRTSVDVARRAELADAPASNEAPRELVAAILKSRRLEKREP